MSRDQLSERDKLLQAKELDRVVKKALAGFVGRPLTPLVAAQAEGTVRAALVRSIELGNYVLPPDLALDKVVLGDDMRIKVLFRRVQDEFEVALRSQYGEPKAALPFMETPDSYYGYAEPDWEPIAEEASSPPLASRAAAVAAELEAEDDRRTQVERMSFAEWVSAAADAGDATESTPLDVLRAMYDDRLVAFDEG